MKKLYVGNLPWSISEDDLKAAFAAHGEVSSANIMTERDSGRSRGFGFVEMEDDAAADAAVTAMNGVAMDGTDRELVVNEARPMEERPVGNEVYVGNLPFDVTEDDLSGIFGEVGELASVKLINDRETGQSKGFGFVNFVNTEDAEKAIAEWDGKALPNSDRELRVNASRGK